MQTLSALATKVAKRRELMLLLFFAAVIYFSYVRKIVSIEEAIDLKFPKCDTFSACSPSNMHSNGNLLTSETNLKSVVTVIGTRPQYMKAAAVSDALRKVGISELLVDTGQGYLDLAPHFMTT